MNMQEVEWFQQSGYHLGNIRPGLQEEQSPTSLFEIEALEVYAEYHNRASKMKVKTEFSPLKNL